MGGSASGRGSYNQIAGLYDRARPGYPEALFDDIVALSRIPPKGHILEVGCGTGQATVPMARRGFHIDAVELGGELAAIAAAKLARFPNAKVIHADFETMPMRRGHYDLLLSATAFHWIAPDLRFKRAYEALKPGRALALFWIRPALTDASRHFHDQLQEVYEQIAPQLTRYYARPPHPSEVNTEFADAIPASSLFDAPRIRKHLVATEYSADAYIDLLGTFSDHLLLPADSRRRLFDDIKALIDREFDGAIVREGVALLYVARRL